MKRHLNVIPTEVEESLLKQFNSNAAIWFFITIFVLSFVIRLLLIQDNNLAFTQDQARDMLSIRAIVHDQDLPLIGPITGIPGLYLGPFWFFFNLIPFVISGGNPVSLVIWQDLWFHLSALLLYFYLKKRHPRFAFTSSTLYLISPIYFYTSRYSFNPHLLPPFTIFFLILLDQLHTRVTALRLIFLGLLAGICLQLEAATAIVYLPVALLLLPRKSKPILIFLFALFVTLIPQLVFELRHNFIMTKVVLDQLTGKNDVIKTALGLTDLLSDRFNSLKYLFAESLPLSYYLTIISFIFSLLLYCHSEQRRGIPFLATFFNKPLKHHQATPLLVSSLLFLIFFFLLFLIYPHPIKSWYLYPLALTPIFYIATLLARFPRFLSATILTILVFFSFYGQFQYLESLKSPSLDPSNLNNRLQTIDKVYELASGEGFVVYNYLPSVYDYPYQYLFWWKGKIKGYHPQKITYQDNAPEYIPNNDKFFTFKKPAIKTFLIIEEPESIGAKSWLDQFQPCKSTRLDLPWKTTIIQLSPCINK